MLIPYLFWTIVYSVISSYPNMNTLWGKIVRNIITGNAASPLYYILLLFQMEVLLPYIIKGIENKKTKVILWGITPIYLLYVYIWYFSTGEHPPFYGTLFPAYLMFYLIGIEVRKEWHQLKTTKFHAEVLVLCGLILSVAESLMLSNIGFSKFAVSQIKISSFLYSVALILLFIKYEGVVNKLNKVSVLLKRIGDDSYSIFYLHCFCIKIIGLILVKLPIFLLFPWLLQTLIYFIASIAMCEIIIYAVRRFAKAFKSSSYLKYIAF